jgi:multidrug resistance efflux pump
MQPKLASLIYASIVLLLLASACGGAAPSGGAEPTAIPTVIADTEVVAEGRIVPKDDVNLSFFASGQVDEVLVEEGDQVKAGDIVARLGNREEIEANMANGQAELLAAQQARQALFDNVDIARAEAARAISEANRQVRDAQYALDNFTVPTTQQGMTARDGVVTIKEALDKARAAFEEVKFRSSNDPTRKTLKEDLDNAQSEYNSAVRRLELETTLSQAQASLDKALQDSQDLEAGPDADQVAAADARVAAAEAAIRSAEAALSNLELIATIDGTVVEQNLVVGQAVTPGQAVMRIVDFSQMFVETDDLTELEVVEISMGQKASIVADALPDTTLNGTVDKIANVFEEKRGDITYTVRIKLDDFDPRLRWGMTVAVTFAK